jgi:adenylate cyclase
MPLPTYIYGRNGSSTTLATSSHCRTILRAGSQSRWTLSWLVLSPLGRLRIPTRLTTFSEGALPMRSRQPPTNTSEAVSLFERALVLDPRSVEAQNRLAIGLTGRVLDQMSADPAADIARAEGLVRHALKTAPRSPLVHFAKGQVLRVQKRYADAIPEYETAITFNRNWVNVFGPLGECKLLTGSIDEMIPLMKQAVRLSPRDPLIGVRYFRIGLAHLLQSRVEEAIVWFQKACGANAELPYAHSHLASAYALRGETERAAIELLEARRLSLDGRYSSVARLQATAYYGVPKIRALFEATYFAGLRLAGMPKE